MRAEGSRFPTIRFISSTSTEADSDILHSFTLLLKFRDRRHSSRPSKMNNTLYLSLDIFHFFSFREKVMKKI